MAVLTSRNEGGMLKIREFLGLNENPDGDTHIKTGEMSECRNFSVTMDRHLQLRPGQKTVTDLKTAWDALPVRPAGVTEPVFCGAWSGILGGARHVIASFGGRLWEVSLDGGAAVQRGSCTQAPASFFGFGGKLYMLNGNEYMSWGGGPEPFQAVEGYIPTVRTASTPAGEGTLLENVNRLTGKRRIRFSPDGTSTTFFLEKDYDEVVSVEGAAGAYTLDKAAGTMTFAGAPAEGVNTLTVVYRKGEGARGDVEHMRFAEFYNGQADTRVFLYGDGTNKTIYSGVDIDSGAPSAEYFPDLYEAAVGDSNTPITALLRHYSRLLAFKQDSTYVLDHTTVTNALGRVTAAFQVLPVNRLLGNEAPGQVKLLENDPLALAEQNIYKWTVKTVGWNAASDVRGASRISDRVRGTLSGFDFRETVTFNRLRASEFWFLYGDRALIYNYGADAWYVYDNMPFLSMLEIGGELYGFTRAGGVRRVDRQYRGDDGEEIRAYAATGAMDFDRDWLLKYSPMLFVAIKPESGARVYVTVETNRRSDYRRKIVSAGLATFEHVDFRHFSFGTNRKPKVKRVKMKVKKATHYKLIFESASASSAATVLETDVQLRYAGNVK